ncbi:MAG TPA: glycosyltransferase [Candidatus Bathyarchaeota archaeon]|nr:glycosyltransferase [Candidatus Bathyarchaeota archaeon]
MVNLKRYKKIVGNEILDSLSEKAEKLSDKHILHVNSTYIEGGITEILNTTVPLFNELGIKMGWRVIHGSRDFFITSKKFHDALEGVKKINFSKNKRNLYYDTNKKFSTYTHIDHDLVVTHDAQPLALIDFHKKEQPWIWRCHADLSSAEPDVWNYMKGFLEKYDHMVVSHKSYMRNDLSISQNVIPPAIDPLSIKNVSVTEKTVHRYLTKYGISTEKPLVSQMARFNKLKDQIGLIHVFNKVRKKVDCQLVLLGFLALDNVEGQETFEKVEKLAAKSKYKEDIKPILVNSDILVNCLQRASAVTVLKSFKEGFGLVVAESLYKGTPVVASDVGGIPLQVIDGVTGFLHEPNDLNGFCDSILKLLKDKKLREKLGKNGQEHVKKSFLITRLMSDWIDLYTKYLA